ncbi:NADH:flavin oxidoreductase [Ectothiorhodospira lacustris]|uniref:NADH:flavin oxidoreductase n=1 Tax=Ectothiorhodospira lacustris TaxID=2899127 RepID=UPI001EE94488|nr:NADH:flavin oxidoreductase [Ectothiorhodospira lacustris]MCG5508754.1 NADH:flavin oxidoreductase [Ectothiorhodospira lacustris]MCG5520545.1 NADH:flavin oxidoreductase [Ectothiorhodospira lacustris]
MTTDPTPPEQDPIFTPLVFRNLTLKNRILRSNISGRFDNEDGSLTQTRINWECRFAQGGVGAILSSYVPVAMHGRIIAGYATIHRNDFIPLWTRLGEAVHRHDCRFILQLSHSGRQMDLPGIHNQHRPAPSPTHRKEPLHGFLCRAMGEGEIQRLVDAFAQGAWRAREAGLDGVELHAANGYLFTQFLSSAINDRTDRYGGSLTNRARFLLEVIEAIRQRVGRDFHLQVKLSAIDHNQVLPWEKPGNTLADTIQVARWCEATGADAIHVSTGAMFPHPLNPPGELPLETLAVTYDAMISAGVNGFRNYLLFRYPLLRPLFRWLWHRMQRGLPIEGVSLDEARAIKRAVSIPVITTGGYQSADFVRAALSEGACDGVAIARSLVANPDLVQQWRAGRNLPERPCTYCNKCLTNAPKNPMGCYEQARYPSREAMIEEIMSIYRTRAELRIPEAEGH